MRILFRLPIIFSLVPPLLIQLSTTGQKPHSYRICSPGGHTCILVTAGDRLIWSLQSAGQDVLAPSKLALTLADGTTWGVGSKQPTASTHSSHVMLAAVDYKKDSVSNNYTEITLRYAGEYGIRFRAYDDGAAYQWFSWKKDRIRIASEEADFQFPGDDSSYVPYVNDPHDHDMFQTSFENNYLHIPLSQWVRDTLAFAPVLVELPGGRKAALTEADLEDYPGMFLEVAPEGHGLRGRFAPAVLAEKPNPHNDAQALVAHRADYLAETAGNRTFPWRVVILSDSDKTLLDNDMIYRLASPSRITDPSWIKPGKVAWDWWNDWNISHVNFRAGINTDTYRYYIDFASSHHLEYILLDAGWSDGKDLMTIVPAIDLPQIIAYGRQKNVGVWLWAGSFPMAKKMDEVLGAYAKMGIKGFKVDFMDRDDQQMVNFYYELARKAADQHLMLDFHGAYKPTGLRRTFPNVVNFEGVRGLENAKWSNTDFPLYDATIPYIRMLAGPMDYTPGAMKNANKTNFRPINAAPMSQGTRCHQIAMYILYEAPFEMLSDNPTNYLREEECTAFIASIPTTFDQTVALAGRVGEFAAIARRKGDTWYVAVLGNWQSRNVPLDLSFLGPGRFRAEVLSDGLNADREATDYVREIREWSSSDRLTAQLSTGGGWAAILRPLGGH